MNDFNNIAIEAMTRQYARDSGIIVTYEYKKVLQEVRAFFVKYEKYLQTSMPVFQNDIIKSLTLLRLSEQHQAKLDKLHLLMQKFLRVITLESEFLEYQATPDHEFPAYFDEADEPIPIDH